MKIIASFLNPDRQQLLRLGLAGNALFSGLSGTLLAFWSESIATLLGTDAAVLVLLIGIGLLLFSAELWYQVTRKRLIPWRALLASCGDCLWVVASVMLLIWVPEWFSATGRFLVAAVALVVAFFGISQLIGIRRIFKIPGEPRYRHCIRMETGLEPDALWSRVGDIGAIANFAPFLKESRLQESATGEWIGAIRTCTDNRGVTWSEACTDYRPGQSLDLRFITEEPGFQFPVREMVGGWCLYPSDMGCEVEVWWEMRLKAGLPPVIAMPLMAAKADRDIAATIRAMVSDIGELSLSKHVQRKGLRLLPKFC